MPFCLPRPIRFIVASFFVWGLTVMRPNKCTRRVGKCPNTGIHPEYCAVAVQAARCRPVGKGNVDHTKLLTGVALQIANSEPTVVLCGRREQGAIGEIPPICEPTTPERICHAGAMVIRVSSEPYSV